MLTGVFFPFWSYHNLSINHHMHLNKTYPRKKHHFVTKTSHRSLYLSHGAIHLLLPYTYGLLMFFVTFDSL